MDLGAPLLDVVVGSTSVVSDGVVVAPGFKPVVITQTATNKDFVEDDKFNPVDISMENTTSIEIEKQQVVINGTETAIVYTEAEGTVATVIVTASITLLVFLVVVALWKYFGY
mmetsp:Transcript_29160/g.43939  ORF Transcript_29160/g.43939 Transcript_29160/m.43939 type:complete len:113 (-) Transcript_29160:549-887(-)